MAPATEERIDHGTGTGLGAPWNVIVLNDNHNTFQGVASALASTLPEVSYDQGLRIADRIHSSGRAIVWSGHKEVAEHYWQRYLGDGLSEAPTKQSRSAFASSAATLSPGSAGSSSSSRSTSISTNA